MTEHANIELTRFLDTDPACNTEDARKIATDAFTAGYNSGYKQGKMDGGEGKITLARCRELADTYDGGESRHPLARHRDSMG